MMKKRSLFLMALTVAFSLAAATVSVSAVEPSVEGKYLDSFDRAQLAVDGSNNTLSDGTLIYWNGQGAGTFSITDGVLNAQMNDGGYYRFATNNSESFKYVVIRIKGDDRAVNDRIYTRIGAAETGAIDDNAQRGDKSFAQLKAPDGQPIPEVSKEWQDITIDIAQSGFSLGGGSNGFQIGSWQPMNLDIDYIFMTNTAPNTSTNTSTNTNPGTNSNTNPSTGDSLPVATLVAVLASAAVIIVLSKKKPQQQ